MAIFGHFWGSGQKWPFLIILIRFGQVLGRSDLIGRRFWSLFGRSDRNRCISVPPKSAKNGRFWRQKWPFWPKLGQNGRVLASGDRILKFWGLEEPKRGHFTPFGGLFWGPTPFGDTFGLKRGLLALFFEGSIWGSPFWRHF